MWFKLGGDDHIYALRAYRMLGCQVALFHFQGDDDSRRDIWVGLVESQFLSLHAPGPVLTKSGGKTNKGVTL